MASDVKTKKTNASVKAFLESLKSEQRRQDAFTVLELMKKITKEPPRMWGPTMVGFGDYHYKYDSGREGDSFRTGFSPRKDALVVYLMADYETAFPELMRRLGKHSSGKSCLYIKSLDDIHVPTLRKLITASLRSIKS